MKRPSAACIGLFLLGGLIAIPAGLATGAFLTMAIETGPFFGILPTVLVFGALPLLIGILVIRAGMRRHRREQG
jgi:hypothetical protein